MNMFINYFILFCYILYYYNILLITKKKKKKKKKEPNNDSPLNTYAAQMWNKPEEYKKQVIKIHNSVA